LSTPALKKRKETHHERNTDGRNQVGQGVLLVRVLGLVDALLRRVNILADERNHTLIVLPICFKFLFFFKRMKRDRTSRWSICLYSASSSFVCATKSGTSSVAAATRSLWI